MSRERRAGYAVEYRIGTTGLVRLGPPIWAVPTEESNGLATAYAKAMKASRTFAEDGYMTRVVPYPRSAAV